VIAAVRAGANDFLTQPLRRLEFKDAMARFERAPKREHGQTQSRLGKVWTFLGVKGGVGTTTMAVNFAAVLAQRKHSAVLLDLDWTADDCALQLGIQPQYTLIEVGENLERMDQALFEGYVSRDPVGFFLVGPPDSLETQGYFSEPMFRDFSNFLVEKYEHIVIDAGRSVQNEVIFGALQVSSSIMLVMTQEFPAIRNAQRYLSYLMRLGVSQDQIKIVVNQYQQTLNQPVFFGLPSSPAVPAAINRARPFVVDRQAAGELDATFRRFVDKATGRQKELTKSA
jgi:pilus assembly protein CpaE